MKTFKGENIRLIFSIIFTSTILVGSTFLWKNLNNNYDLVNSVLNDKTEQQVILMENIDICSDKESENLWGYNFVIDSNYETEKTYNVQILGNHIKNEDIHYSIDNGEIMTLNSDNMILRKNILANDEHSYIFKVWLTNEYENNDLNVLINFE